MFASSGESNAALRRSDLLRCHLPVLHHPGFQPFADQADHAPVADPMFHEPDEPVMVTASKNPAMSASSIQFTLLVLIPTASASSASCWTAPRPEPVREPEEIFLVDRVQHLHHRALDDLVLQRRDAERALPAVRFGYVMPP